MFAWLIEKILLNIPAWCWLALAVSSLAVNLASGLLSRIPTFAPYHIFIKPVTWIGILVGVFMYGGSGVTAIYQARVKELQAEVATAMQASEKVNTQIVTKLVTDVQVIHEKQIEYQDRIVEVAAQLDADCKFDKAASKILNDAAKNPLKAKQ